MRSSARSSAARTPRRRRSHRRRCASTSATRGIRASPCRRVSAVDIALWDLKARLLDVPLADLLPRAHESVPVYGSGGFTSYTLGRLCEQLGDWVADGIPRVKMKLGRDPERDAERLDAARQAIGDDAELYVDAN